MSQIHSGTQANLLPDDPTRKWLVLGMVLLVALSVRLFRLNAPPVDFHPTRQYRSLVIARAEYFDTQPSIPGWRRNVASLNKQAEGLREPQFLEFAAARLYNLAGGEYPWIGRLLSIVFWLLGGVVIYLLGERLFYPDAALFSMAMFLFLPFSIAISRSVQPESFMILMMLLGIYLALGTGDQWPSAWRILLAALASMVAMLIKPYLVFIILGALFAYYQRIHGFRLARQLPWWLFIAVSLVPVLAYYLYGWFTLPSIRTLTDAKFLPALWGTGEFWSGLFLMIGRVVGHVSFVGGLLAFLLTQRDSTRRLLFGLWGGYILSALVFTYVAYTHDYYNVALLPVVALSCGPLGSSVVSAMVASYPHGVWRGAFVVALSGVAGFIGLVGVKQSVDCRIYATTDESIVSIAPEIGEQVGHSTRTVFLADDYGMSLKYYGEIAGDAWPRTSDLYVYRLTGQPSLSVQQRFKQYGTSADYFIVTSLAQLQSQQDLQDFLFTHYPVLTQAPAYIIFDLRKKLEK